MWVPWALRPLFFGMRLLPQAGGGGCPGDSCKGDPVIIVVGVGADGTAGISEVAKSELRSAAVIYGAPRQLAPTRRYRHRAQAPWLSPMMPALRHLLDDAGARTSTLSPAATLCCMASAAR